MFVTSIFIVRVLLLMSYIKNLKKFGGLIVVTAVAVGFTSPRGATAETLADALVGAYNHSGLLEQNRAVLRAADEDVAIAGSTLKPVLSWSGNVTQSFGTTRVGNAGFAPQTENMSVTISLIGQLLLYDFGASQFRVEAAKETVLATRGTLQNIEQLILLRAVSAYMGVIQASDFVALRNNNVRLLTQELRAARDRFEVGEVTRTDVALAEAQLAQARYFANGNQLDPESVAALDKALELQPNNPTALGLLGIAAFEAGDYNGSIGYWERLLKATEPGSQGAQAIQGGIDRARERMAATGDTAPVEQEQGPAIRLTVSVAPELMAQLDPNSSVFVFAREPNGPPMPLIAKRLTLSSCRSISP